MAATTTIRAGISASMTNVLDEGTASVPVSISGDTNLASGTASGQADLVWADQRTITASSNEDLDLAGSLAGLLGGTLTIVKLKAIVVKAAAGNTNNVVVKQSASNGVANLFTGASAGISIPPGGMLVWTAPAAGVTVTAGTGDLLNFSNSGAGTSVTYDVAFVGTSA